MATKYDKDQDIKLIRKAFNFRFVDLVREKNLTVNELIKELGVTRQGFYYLMNNQGLPSLPTLIKMAVFFDKSLDYIIGLDLLKNEHEEVQPESGEASSKTGDGEDSIE